MEPEKLLEALHTAEKLKDTTRHCYCSILSLERDSNNYYFIIRGSYHHENSIDHCRK